MYQIKQEALTGVYGYINGQKDLNDLSTSQFHAEF